MANGTIAFDTLSTSGQISGTAKSVDADYLSTGSAKAWGQFEHDPVINKGFNTASITDNASGRFTMNYTSNMRAAKAYTISGHNADATDVTTYSYGTQPHQDDDVTTSSAEVVTVYVTSNDSGISDKAFNSFLIHGDLA